MAIQISTADFKIKRAVCEIRYQDAYLIYDRTGKIFHEMKAAFTDVRVLTASPNQSAFQSKEANFGLELTQCRITSDEPDSSLERFADHCKTFFGVVAEQLDIRVFTRIGLRVFFRKSFMDHEEAKRELDALDLVKRPPAVRFGASELPEEVMFRWESTEIGTLLRLKAEKGTIDVVLPPELEAADREIHKKINALLIDVDFYTVAPVERSQWDATAWVPQSFRTVRREVNSFLEG